LTFGDAEHDEHPPMDSEVFEFSHPELEDSPAVVGVLHPTKRPKYKSVCFFLFQIAFNYNLFGRIILLKCGRLTSMNSSLSS
jgi:hypothetical protein